MAERWLTAPGWPGYEVSDLGRVRSVPRTLTDGRTAGGVLLRPTRNGEGYLTVTLAAGRHRRTVAVHVLVLAAFTGPPPEGKPQVRHLDGDQENCTLANLEYGDQEENEADKRKGRGRKGKRNTGTGNKERETGTGGKEGRGAERINKERGIHRGPGTGGCGSVDSRLRRSGP